MQKKIFKVRTLQLTEMHYLVEAVDNNEAEWMIKNIGVHDKIIGYDYDQRNAGEVVQKVKQVSENKAKELIREAYEQSAEGDLAPLDCWLVTYREKDEEDDEDLAELNCAIERQGCDDEEEDEYDYLRKPVDGQGKM
jgi:hypothetical protein